MAKVGATEFKARCLEIMDRVAERHESYVITKRGRPVATLGPVAGAPRSTLFGCLRDRAEIAGDLLKPVADQWEVVGEWDRVVSSGSAPRSVRPARRKRRR
jgi:prevent-host-death family protein